MNTTTFGQRIKTLRLAKGWTQKKLADRIGIQRASLTQWETGDTESVRDENLLAAARELETTPEYLLTGKNPPPPPIASIQDSWPKLTPAQKESVAALARSLAEQNQEILDALK
jgi:transcriptional regulator with XRE-family HTH domain